MADQASCRWWSTLKGTLVRTRAELVVDIVQPTNQLGWPALGACPGLLSGGKLMAVCVASYQRYQCIISTQRHQFSHASELNRTWIPTWHGSVSDCFGEASSPTYCPRHMPIKLDQTNLRMDREDNIHNIYSSCQIEEMGENISTARVVCKSKNEFVCPKANST